MSISAPQNIHLIIPSLFKQKIPIVVICWVTKYIVSSHSTLNVFKRLVLTVKSQSGKATNELLPMFIGCKIIKFVFH